MKKQTIKKVLFGIMMSVLIIGIMLNAEIITSVLELLMWGFVGLVSGLISAYISIIAGILGVIGILFILFVVLNTLFDISILDMWNDK